MKKLLPALIASLLISATAFAQSWCPPGATWYYRVYQPFTATTYMDGHLKLQVTNTVVINNIVCYTMDGTFTGIRPTASSPISSINMITLQTYENNKVVYLYNGSQGFDTLADFKAKINDKWLGISYGCQNSQRNTITVLDTGHVIINNMALKSLSVSITSSATNFTTTITERMLGTTGFLFYYQSCTLDSPSLGSFVCYEDNNFPKYDPSGAECAYLPTGIEPHALKNDNIQLYPNPANNLLTIDVPDAKTYSFRITDPLGRSWPLTVAAGQGAAVEANLSGLSPGVYFLEVSANGKALGVEKIIKH